MLTPPPRRRRLATPPPGYLLVVAFDVVLAGVFVPLMAAVYGGKRISANAGLLSCLTGSILRLVLEFTLPKVRKGWTPAGHNQARQPCV